ncbi:MAG: hypothetical protein K8I82_05975 [Anaerolineae bacterium]|nr:hypothetical protein [Anaerolineae bacterium]
MCLLYGISFLLSVVGIFGVGHLFAGMPMKALAYFIAGLVWTGIAGLLGVSTGVGLLCFVPLHLMFAHFCAADAVRRYQSKP